MADTIQAKKEAKISLWEKAWEKGVSYITSPEGAFTLIAAAYGASEDNRRHNELIKNQEKMIEMLEEINGKVDTVISQNIEILKRLDLLPAVIKSIVDDTVKSTTLNEYHSLLKEIRDHILIDRDFESYKRGGRYYLDLTKSLRYLYDY